MKQTIYIDHLVESFANDLFIENDISYTFQSFFNLIENIAQLLTEHMIKKNDIVILHAMSPFKTVLFLFAICKIKAIAFPVNPKLTEDQIQKLTKNCAAKFIISEHSEGFNRIKPNQVFKKAVNLKNAFKSNYDISIPAISILTSGSTGEPKIAVFSLANFIFNARAVNHFFNSKANNRWLLSLPLYHVGGLAIIFRCLLVGATVYIPDKERNITDTLDQAKPTHLSLVSTQLWRLLKNKNSISILRKCQVIFLGGSSIPASLIKAAKKEGLNIYTSYGLTEMASSVAIKTIVDSSTARAKVLPGIEVKINDNNEIYLKGNSLFLGYLENGKIVKKTDNAGWFHSKDLGIVTEKGTISVLGRKDNMFISGGENIYPEEIEKYLLQMDEIKEAVVVPVDNKEFGRRPVAFIRSDFKLNSRSIKNHLKNYLPPFKIPDRFLTWPKNYHQANLKTDRSFFRSLL